MLTLRLIEKDHAFVELLNLVSKMLPYNLFL
jgi:hypothetical protein